jgi:DNA-binding NarL/FixJ family response regulator
VAIAPSADLTHRRVLIVDDHARFRDLAGALLRRGGFEVVAEAGTLADALLAIDDLHPELVLMDIGLPDADGIVGAARIADLPQAPDVVLVSARRAGDFGRRLDGACARGFITKDELSVSTLQALL